LIQETVVTVPRDLIVQAIDIIVFIAGRGNARRIETLLELTGLDDDGSYQVTPIGRPTLHTI
jgi:type IV secretion system protein VirB11